ncbi:MAG TPA: adenylate/guanylate cyclase domain-containing protein [Chloroflexota bacterium]|nr:adenylate/guanylate cyclase domain-containing protein [Chloroflexota bacterium]
MAASLTASPARTLPIGGMVAALALLAAPLGLLFWLLQLPSTPPTRDVSFQHLVVVANVSLLALLVAVMVARSALQQRAFRVLFLALGFLSMSGFFAVHALATPGVILPASSVSFVGDTYSGALHEEHSALSVLGISAYLSLLVPALFFAGRYLPIDWADSKKLTARTRLVAAVLALVLVVYGTLGLAAPGTLALLPLLQPPIPYLAAGLSVALLLFAAWRQSREFLSTRLPMQAAQVAAFLLLADAQVAMVISPVWGLAWWEYHVLMLTAVVFALWALFIELDRRRGFERFLSPAVVERVMSGEAIKMGGERRVVTILFGDLRGSTALAETLTPDGVVKILNSYVGTMAQCVFDNGGILDKFLGDGLMAIFGVLPDPSHGAAAAARTAAAIRAGIGAINAERAAQGESQVGFGVGIHTGEVVLGAVGLPQRSDFTAIGDTVNTASRLESLCKEFHVDSVLSADAAALLDQSAFRLTRLGTTAIRGKANEVEVFTLGSE